MTCPADCTKLKPAEEMASAVYNEAVKVPFMAKFVVFGRRTSSTEGQLRIFCLTDEADLPATFSAEDGFVEIARSGDVEVDGSSVDFYFSACYKFQRNVIKINQFLVLFSFKLSIVSLIMLYVVYIHI